MTTRGPQRREVATSDDRHVIRFAQGRHAFLLTNEGDLSGTVILRPLTRGDVLGSDVGRALALVEEIIRERRPTGDASAVSCFPVVAHCGGKGNIGCACLCERCTDHVLECGGCAECDGEVQ